MTLRPPCTSVIPASELGITVAKTVSLLTELEHRDEVIIDISSNENTNNPPGYKGFVRLMRTPPDEAEESI